MRASWALPAADLRYETAAVSRPSRSMRNDWSVPMTLLAPYANEAPFVPVVYDKVVYLE